MESHGEPGDAAARWAFDARDAQAASHVRSEVVAELARADATDESIMAAELIYSELVGNVVRHAFGNAEVCLDWPDGTPVLHVLDEGPGFHYVDARTPDLLSESGRGLFLVAAMSQGIDVHHRQASGSHVRAILSFAKRELQAAHG